MNKEKDTVIKLREGENAEPIIFIHPIGGTLFTYKALIARLNTHSPIYGIQDNFSNGQYKKYESLIDQAKYYVQEVFDKINTNSLTLLGYSSGGSLAFEMARQCTHCGVTVKKILMFDTWVKTPFDKHFKTYFEKIILRQIEKLDATQYLENGSSKTLWLNRLWERMNLLFSFMPQPITIPLVLFKASEHILEYDVDEEKNYAWEPLVKSLALIPVAGNHENMLDAQYVDQLSQKVNKFL